jgi:hypothetical protein
MASQDPASRQLKPSKSKLEKLKAIARKASANAIGCEPDDVDDVLEDGFFLVPTYSTVVFVFAEIEPEQFSLEATILKYPEDDPAAVALIGYVNDSIELGTMHLHDNRVMYRHTINAQGISVDDLASVVQSFASTADLLDERFQSRLGGTTSFNRAHDKVWI